MTVEHPVEIELKYSVADRAIGEGLVNGDALGTFSTRGPSHSAQHEDRYLDTADGALARAGFVARLRSTAAGTMVSVKSTASSDGALHRRDEIEGPATRAAQPADWPSSAARSLILELCGDAPLVELVTVRQLRRRRDLVAPGGQAAVELSLDEVDVINRGRVVDRFVELELELTRGSEADLIPLQALLDQLAGLQPSTTSKFERALAALQAGSPARIRPIAEPSPTETAVVDLGGLDGESAQVHVIAVDRIPVGKSPGVTADDLFAEAGRKVLRFHLARMLDREAGTRGGSDPEELHGMRVATRRMRAAWRVFGEGFRKDRTSRYRRRLRVVAARLGTVRDLDVLIEATNAFAATLPEDERQGLQPLIAAWRDQRDSARQLLIRELDSSGYRRFVADYRDFVLTPGADLVAVQPTSPHRVRDTAGSRIVEAYELVRAFEAVLRWADVPTLHQLRITAKRLRYAIEFVREALGPEGAGLIARVVALQDHLGALNDAHVAAQMARDFLVECGADLSGAETAAISRYLLTREREVTSLRRTVGAPWRGVAGLRFRRALGRAIATL